jgi:hypothetical protein
MMIVHDQQMTPIDFGVKVTLTPIDSGVKGQSHIDLVGKNSF